MQKKLNRFIMINIGLLIMASGLYFFLIPAELAVGGVTGLAMVIQTFFPQIDLGPLMLIFNFILFVLAFLVIGFDFGGYTIYCSFGLSGFVWVMEKILYLDGPLVDDIFLNLIYGILIQGVGMAIIFYYNASTGGTDIIAKIMNKYTNIPIGRALFLADSVITLMAGLTFGLELGLYAFIGILVNGLVIDRVIAGFDQKMHIQIITQEEEKVKKFITVDLDRGFTFINALGGYTLVEKKIISVVLSRRQYMSLKHFIEDIDPAAFMTVNYVNEVIGNGFDRGHNVEKA